MKKKVCSLLAAVLLFSSAAFPVSAATSGSVKDLAGVPTADNVSLEMMKAQFWIDKTPNAYDVVLSPEQIAQYNQLNAETLAKTAGAYYDIGKYQDTMPGAELKTIIEKGASPSTSDRYVDGKKVTPSYWQTLQKKTWLEGISTVQKVRFGVMTERSSIRSFPTNDVVTDDPKDICYDVLQESAVLYNEPVVVLHQTQDAQWYYIEMFQYRGWVPAAHVGLFQSRAEWETARSIENRDFLVVTGNKITLEPDPYAPALSSKELSMGTLVEVAPVRDYPQSIGDRVPMNNYVIKLPVRLSSGLVKYEYALLPVNRDVSRGYLSYTRASVLNQAFKMLGDRYGWGGMLDSRDCSSFVFEVYRCYGIQLPRNSSAQALIPCKTSDFSGMTTAERKLVLDELKPGSILHQPGHITLYLGKFNDRYYVINATGGFASVGTSAPKSARIRTVVVNELEVRRANGTTWLDSLMKAKEIGSPIQ